MVIFNLAQQKLMKSYVEYPPRPLQSESYTGPLSIGKFRTMEQVKMYMKKNGIVLPELD